MRIAFAIALGAAALAGCQSAPQEEPRATAQLKPLGKHKAFGEATFDQVGNKVRVVAYVQGLTPGREHGFHIHEAGDCSSPDGMSAKGHFNPSGKPHGNPASAERHAGDLPALSAAKNGRAKLDTEVTGITVGPGPNSIVGKGVIIHADPDDYKTQPTGNAGARIACGVVKAG